MDMIDLLKFALEHNGYDGLFCSDDGCACCLDDLIPCGEPSMECEAGYKVVDMPSNYCGDPCDFYIVKDKNTTHRQ